MQGKEPAQCFSSNLLEVTPPPLALPLHLWLKGLAHPENPEPPVGALCGPLRLRPLPAPPYQLSNLPAHSDTQLQEMKTVLLIDETLDKITWF